MDNLENYKNNITEEMDKLLIKLARMDLTELQKIPSDKILESIIIIKNIIISDKESIDYVFLDYITYSRCKYSKYSNMINSNENFLTFLISEYFIKKDIHILKSFLTLYMEHCSYQTLYSY